MASIEFLQKRIAGKEAEIAKLNKKMERILKAEASNWENNPYYYHESDKRYTQRDIDDALKALQDYQEKLTQEIEKAGSRNVIAITQFLDNWKARVRQYHIDSVPAYLEARAKWYAYDHEYCDQMNYKIPHSDTEQRKQLRMEHDQVRKEYLSTWSWLTEYMNHDELDLKKLDKVLEQEANRKYDFIIERTNAIVGKITDASNLKVGAKQDLNGFIIGTKGKAKVQTIGAGGYNIQCYHFRTLINEMK